LGKLAHKIMSKPFGGIAQASIQSKIQELRVNLGHMWWQFW